MDAQGFIFSDNGNYLLRKSSSFQLYHQHLSSISPRWVSDFSRGLNSKYIDFKAAPRVGAEYISAKRRRLDVNKDLLKDKLASVAGQVGREVHVFVSPLAGNSNGPKHIPDEPDEFYEFTNEDYFRLMASKKEDNILKTKKLRDAEKAARRTNFSKTVIRVQFPDNYIIEADFEPSETISTLMDLLRKVVARPELPFYIYTTPPKKIITDLMKDFYSSNLVPLALVRFQYDVPEEEDKGPFLRDEIAALCDLHLFVGQKEEQKPADPSLSAETPEQVLDNKPAVKKAVKPKWLKM